MKTTNKSERQKLSISNLCGQTATIEYIPETGVKEVVEKQLKDWQKDTNKFFGVADFTPPEPKPTQKTESWENEYPINTFAGETKRELVEFVKRQKEITLEECVEATVASERELYQTWPEVNENVKLGAKMLSDKIINRIKALMNK